MTTQTKNYIELLQRVNATYHVRKLDKGYTGEKVFECESDQIHALLWVTSEELTKLYKKIVSLNEELQELKSSVRLSNPML